jgi:hypothetical protein
MREKRCGVQPGLVIARHCHLRRQLLKHRVLADIVNVTTIIRIDQAKIPHLRALIAAGDPRGDDLQEGLREGVKQAARAHALLKGQ